MTLIRNDCLAGLAELADDSVESLITDPPAGISFMGKDWDSNKGGRDHHWTATALENAGFEVRDVVTHIFGSGFPKSLDISKAIDKAAGAEREKGAPKPYTNENIKNNNFDAGGGRERIQTFYELPSTDSAKQWSGWGTALKPSFEAWLLVAKPFTTVPLDTILDDLNSILREYLCQKLPVKYADQVSRSNLRDFDGQQFAFAQWLVDVFHIVRSNDQELRTDTSISQETGSTYLSIVTLWKDILDALLLSQNTFITSMESSLITELKILKSSISQIIQGSIIPGETQASIDQSTAIAVQSLLISGLLRLKGLMEIFVQENASLPAENSNPGQKNQLLSDLATIKGVLSEHFILVRKPLSEKTVAANVLKHGTGGLNIDGSRIEGKPRTTHKDGNFRTDTGNAYHGSNPMPLGQYASADGRFPANLVLSHNDDCDEACTEGCAVSQLDEQSGILKSGAVKLATNTKQNGSKNINYGGGQAVRETPANEGGASRFFYCAKASKKDKGAENIHPTVKSTKLMEYLIKLITPPGGVVLDPFMGSGSTGVAAKRLGFGFVGIERDENYFEIASRRVK